MEVCVGGRPPDVVDGGQGVGRHGGEEVALGEDEGDGDADQARLLHENGSTALCDSAALAD